MRRRGERGHLPGKSIPQRNKPTRVEINEDIDSGVYRAPMNVDKIMAEKFKGEDHIEKFPHGYDPFNEGQTALKTKVVFRPNKHQLDAIRNRKKTISVNAESKVNGQGPVQHQKQFTSKNVNYVELKTHALSGVVARGEHEQPILDKKSRVVQVDSGIDSGHLEDIETGHFKTTKQRKNTQSVDNVSTNADYMEYEPLFISKSEMAKAQYRKTNSIREDFNTKANPDQTIVEHGTISKSSRVTAKNRDVVVEETQANFDGYEIDGDQEVVMQKARKQHDQSHYSVETYQDYDAVEPEITKPKTAGRKQKAEGDIQTAHILTTEIVDTNSMSKSKDKSRHQRELSFEAGEDYTSQPERTTKHRSKKAGRQSQAVETYEDYQTDAAVVEDKSNTKNRRRHQQEVTVETQDETPIVEVERPSIGRMKASRQKAETQRNLESRYDEFSAPVIDSKAYSKSRSRKHNVEAELTTDPNYEVDERPTIVKAKSRRHQAEATNYQTYDESPLVVQKSSQSSTNHGKNRRRVVAAEQEAEINYPTADAEHDKSSRKKASRQKPVTDQEAIVEVESYIRDKPDVKPKRRVQFALDNTPQTIDVGSTPQGSRNNDKTSQRRKSQAVVDGRIANRDDTESGVRVEESRSVTSRRKIQASIDEQIANRDDTESGVRIENHESNVGKRKTQVIADRQIADADNPQSKVEESKEYHTKRKPQAVADNIKSPDPFEIEPKDEIVQPQHRDRQAQANREAAVQETEALAEIQTRESRGIPNIRPVKQQAEPGVMIAIRAPQLDVKTRIEQALERSRRHNAIVEQESTAVNFQAAETGIKPEEIKTSNRRQYSAKQDEEVSGVIVSGHRTDSNDVNKNSNRRQESAAMNGDNQQAIPQSDLEIGARLTAEKQKVDGRVDEADLNQPSGMLNPVDEDAGIDPVSLEAANAKKHVARENSLETTPDTVLYEVGADKTGLETNTRARVLLFDPSILARAQAPTRLRRKKVL